METDLGKLFIGGISWDTDEKRLKEYFGQYGEVLEAMIMKDRITDRARGFGFVVFANPTDAEKVVTEKHMIDGRTVEAKRAVPREDQNALNRNSNTNQGSQSPGRVKKIFVGGLASTVTESDFKKYFDQFGTITDVVVMYDHNTQRPRGFGFITYDSEDAVDRVLFKTFHELNGKMVEVKRAVPKELSPSPNRSPLVGYNYGLSRTSNVISSYPQGYSFSSIGGYGRFNPIASDRNGFLPFGSPGYGVSINMEPGFNGSYGNSRGGLLSPYVNGNLGRFNSSIRYTGGNARSDAHFSATSRNVWGSGSFNHATNATNSPTFLSFGGGNFGANWGSSSPAGGGISGYAGGNLGYAVGDGNYGSRGMGYGRNTGSNTNLVSPLSGSNGGLDSSYGELYRGGSVYGDSTWAAHELDGSGSFGFGLANAGSDVAFKSSQGYMGGYGVANRPANRGVTA